jgi:hypothetical protein
VVSVTIEGPQQNGHGGIGLCLPRPDLITGEPISLTDATKVNLVSLSASVGDTIYQDGGIGAGCSYDLVPGSATGMITFAGFCTATGTSWAMSLAGTVSFSQECIPSVPEHTTTFTLAGTISVGPR